MPTHDGDGSWLRLTELNNNCEDLGGRRSAGCGSHHKQRMTKNPSWGRACWIHAGTARLERSFPKKNFDLLTITVHHVEHAIDCQYLFAWDQRMCDSLSQRVPLRLASRASNLSWRMARNTSTATACGIHPCTAGLALQLPKCVLISLRSRFASYRACQ